MIKQIVTIGAYGFNSTSFFEALQTSHADTFCDVRSRRGVRGSDYSFANRRRLEERLADLGIRYFHFPQLAPSPELRQQQAAADQAAGTKRRARTELSPQFAAGYHEQHLSAFDASTFVQHLGPQSLIVALFCVERLPTACHRLLLANRLSRDLALPISHLVPPTD